MTPSTGLSGSNVRPLDCARDIAERVPGAELKIHTGASHFLLVQRYEEVMADIQRFLADNSPDTK